jgi:hypothetical protein
MKKVAVMVGAQPQFPKDTRGRALKTANRIAHNLRYFDAMPSRRRDQSLIGDLAVLELHSLQLSRGIRALASRPGSAAGRRTIEDRLIDVYGQLDYVATVCRDAAGPVRRWLTARCGDEAVAIALLQGVRTHLEGLGIDTRKPKRARSK